MTEEEVRGKVLEIISFIAPDEDLSTIKDDEPLREQIGLDSMDFVDIVLELRKRHRIQIPEEDYGKLVSMKGIVQYLIPKFQAKA
jgi:acyl carrier protein